MIPHKPEPFLIKRAAVIKIFKEYLAYTREWAPVGDLLWKNSEVIDEIEGLRRAVMRIRRAKERRND